MKNPLHVITFLILSNISVYVHNNHPDISSLFKPEPKTGWLIFSIICLIICVYSTYYVWVTEEL